MWSSKTSNWLIKIQENFVSLVTVFNVEYIMPHKGRVALESLIANYSYKHRVFKRLSGFYFLGNTSNGWGIFTESEWSSFYWDSLCLYRFNFILMFPILFHTQKDYCLKSRHA
jgi:hypothetical protein